MASSDTEDEDYIPNAEAHFSSSSSDSENEQSINKRPRTDPSAELNLEDEQRKRKELWKAFQESVNSDNKDSKARSMSGPRMVKVEKKYLFAGKEITEIVEVSEDSAEAKKWPVIRSVDDFDSVSRSKTGPSLSIPASEATSVSSSTSAAASASAAGPSTSVIPISSSSSSQKLTKKGPRKSKVTLSDIPRSSNSQKQKLTTLEKSAMDWRTHISSQDNSAVKDELEANRRGDGGGYLEKVEFLERVSERRERVLDAGRSGGGKRKRG